ncbi:MAG: metal ABC transporter permease [Acidobacteriota bacterium]
MGAIYAWLAAQASAGRLPAMFGQAFIARGFVAAFLLAPLLGGLSHIVVARRLAFLSAALGHAALTGLTLGIALGEPINAPYGGIVGFCMLSALGMVYVKRRATLPQDTLIGVFLAMSLGLGICLLVAATRYFNIHQIEAVMFGSLITITDLDLLLLLVVALVVFVVMARYYNALVLESCHTTLARVGGVPTVFVDYLFVLLLTAAIVVSLKVIGALLVESLVVVPAAAARNLARSLRASLLWSIAIAWLACVGGLYVSAASRRYPIPSGGAVVLALSLAFFATLGIGTLLRGRSRPS